MVIRAHITPHLPEKGEFGRKALQLTVFVALLRGINVGKAKRLPMALLGKAGQSATTRNWSTTLKLHAMARDGSIQ
jgi:uncharacterized protein (DUF1697 family)